MLAIKKNCDAPGMSWSDQSEIPKLGTHDVLIAVTHAGICGTDRHIYEWDQWSQSRVRLGITVGHEFVGRVVAVGASVTQTSVGERVSAEGHVGCGVCRPCRTGRGHICERAELIGIDRDGCFAQYIAVPQENVWPIHVDIPDHVAAIFDPLGNAMHTVMAAGVSGKRVLISGVGIIGLMAVTIAKAAGAAQILVTDVDQRRLDLAKELGAHEAYSAADDWVEDARDVTGGYGPDVLLEMSGNEQAISNGLHALGNGGTAAMLGIPAKPISLDITNLVIFKGATLLGISGRQMYETWFQVESFVRSGKLNLDPIITHQIEMEDFERGFQLMQNGEAIKVVLRVPQKDFSRCQTSHLIQDAKA